MIAKECVATSPLTVEFQPNHHLDGESLSTSETPALMLSPQVIAGETTGGGKKAESYLDQ